MNVFLLISVLIALYLCIQKYKPNNTDSFVNLDRVYYINQDPSKKIQFNYEQERPIDKQFKKEQINGANLKTWYPNTWIEKIDSNGNPIYNSRENITGVKEDFIESKARFTYEFNSPRSVQMDGIADPDDFKNGQGRTLKEVYDNSFVDYKKYEPTKKIVSFAENEEKTVEASSHLKTFSPDEWVYEEEKPENGGAINNGLYASDPYATNSSSTHYAIF